MKGCALPYLHIDLATKHSLEVKRDLAKRLGNIYAEVMQTTPDLVHVTFRELGEGNVWSCRGETPRPAAMLSLEIRRGRPPEQRERLAEAVLAACVETLGIDPTLAAVEMTQHSGDEIYLADYVDGVLRGALGVDWAPNEVGNPLRESMIENIRSTTPA
jgi:phenylpyruvate tautomerase PptA (4-oxalocrotonate tautomerase family)